MIGWLAFRWCCLKCAWWALTTPRHGPVAELRVAKEYLLKAQIADLEAELAELRLVHARCRR